MAAGIVLSLILLWEFLQHIRAPKGVGSTKHFWDQRSYRGQPGVKLFWTALWLSNFVGSEVQCWGHRSYRGQPGSSKGQIAQECSMATKFTTAYSYHTFAYYGAQLDYDQTAQLLAVHMMYL